MSFDPRIIEARLALGIILPEEMPAVACDALEANLDGFAIRRLAGLIRPSGWEVDQVLPAFMTETNLKKISLQEASVRIAQQLADRILHEDLDPLAYTSQFALLWIGADYPEAIAGAGMLDDEKAYGLYESESEMREHVRSVLRALVAVE